MIDILNQKVKYSLCSLLIFWIISSFVPTVILAQNGSGSVYSVFGIGEISPTLSVQSRAMGGASIGLTDPYFVNVVNPAANDQLSGYANHIVDVGLYVTNTKYESSTSSDNATSGGLSNLNFWFKINDRWNSSIGLSQYSNVGYNILKESASEFESGSTNVLYQGSGGLNELYFSNGVRVIKNLSLGLKLSFIFGNIDHVETISSSLVSTNYELRNETQIKGLYSEYSLNYRLGGEKYFFNFGLLYKNPNFLTGSAESKLVLQGYEDGDDTISEEDVVDEEYVVPTKIGVGVSFNTEKFKLSSEVQFNQWSEAQIPDYEDDLIDTWKYAMGIEITPELFGDEFMKRISYRLGGYYENSYLKVEDTPLNSYGITGGLGLPLKQGSTFNVSYQQRFNGTKKDGLILESTSELTINMTIRSRWFERRKYN